MVGQMVQTSFLVCPLNRVVDDPKLAQCIQSFHQPGSCSLSTNYWPVSSSVDVSYNQLSHDV